MSKAKHSYVAFYMDAWAGGTARMTRLVRSVYWDVCFHNWDKVEPMSESEQMLAFQDVGADGPAILEVLVGTGKLVRDANGGLYNVKAMEEGMKARDLYERKSSGGKKGASKTNGSDKPDQESTGTPAKTATAEVEESSADENRLDKNPTDEEGDAAHLSSADTDKPEEKPKPDPLEKEKRIEKAAQELAIVTQRKADRETVVEAWNDMARAHGFPAVRAMSDKRTTALAARLKQYRADDIVKAIKLIPERAFCVKNRQSWCNIDFLLRPDSVNKLLEGAYGSEEDTEGWASA